MSISNFKYIMVVDTEKGVAVRRTWSKNDLESWIKENKRGQKAAFEVSDKSLSCICPPKSGDFIWSERRGILGTITSVDRMSLKEYSIHYKDYTKESPRRFIEDSCNLIKLERIFPETDVNNCSIIGFFGGRFFFFASEEEAAAHLETSHPVYKVLRNAVPKIGDTVFVNALNKAGGLISKVVDTRTVRFSTGGASSPLYRLENGSIFSQQKLLVVETGRTAILSQSHKNNKQTIIIWNGTSCRVKVDKNLDKIPVLLAKGGTITKTSKPWTGSYPTEEPKKLKKKRAEDVHITYEEYEIATSNNGEDGITISVSCDVRYKNRLTLPRYATSEGLGHASETLSAPLNSFSKKEINKIIRKLKGKALFNALNQ